MLVFSLFFFCICLFPFSNIVSDNWCLQVKRLRSTALVTQWGEMLSWFFLKKVLQHWFQQSFSWLKKLTLFLQIFYLFLFEVQLISEAGGRFESCVRFIQVYLRLHTDIEQWYKYLCQAECRKNRGLNWLAERQPDPQDFLLYFSTLLSLSCIFPVLLSTWLFLL